MERTGKIPSFFNRTEPSPAISVIRLFASSFVSAETSFTGFTSTSSNVLRGPLQIKLKDSTKERIPAHKHCFLIINFFFKSCFFAATATAIAIIITASIPITYGIQFFTTVITSLVCTSKPAALTFDVKHNKDTLLLRNIVLSFSFIVLSSLSLHFPMSFGIGEDNRLFFKKEVVWHQLSNRGSRCFGRGMKCKNRA